MRYGVVLPGGSATEQFEQAVLAERAGWDGVFVWEAAYGVDAWTLLAAIATATRQIALGTMLTPLPWRRPWKVASQAVTLDQLSGGRAILTVGLGAVGTGLPETNEPQDLKERAQRLDEGIDLIRTLWAGKSHYEGKHYHYNCNRDDLATLGRPVRDTIPLWVVAAWPRPTSMRRTLRCEGVVPEWHLDHPATPDDVRAVRAWLTDHKATPDIIMDGESPAENGAEVVRPWAEAGCTWWLETRWEMPHHSPERMTQIQQRITAGPPRDE